MGMVLRLREPPAPERRRFVEAMRETALTYPEVGASRGGVVPPGYLPNRGTARLGQGPEAFARGVAAVRAWKMYDLPWIQVLWPDTPLRVGETVGLVMRHFGTWSLNACRIVYTIDEATRFGFGYGTLPEHGERAEERFTVELRDDGSVWYELFAFSRPNGFLATLGFPLNRALQRRFARESPPAMQRAVAGGSSWS